MNNIRGLVNPQSVEELLRIMPQYLESLRILQSEVEKLQKEINELKRISNSGTGRIG